MNAKDTIIQQRYPFYNPDIAQKDIEINAEAVKELMDEYAQSLLPKWRDISEIDGVEDGTLVILANFIRDSIMNSKLIYFYDYNNKYDENYTHFVILPKL
jgi:hypothetical protein